MPQRLVDNELFVDFDEVDDNSYGQDSEGNPLTEAQLEFFKQSKCLDEYGNLFLVYRATNHDYDTFDISRMGTGAGSIFGKGVYFSTDKSSVKIYGNTIKSYYLNLKNPFIFDAVDTKDDAVVRVKQFATVLKRNNYPVDKHLCMRLFKDLKQGGGLDTMIELTCGSEKATRFFQTCGYDGIMNLDVMDFVAYQPDQIKLSSNKTPTAAVSTAA
jgi:hypothetical protein